MPCLSWQQAPPPRSLHPGARLSSDGRAEGLPLQVVAGGAGGCLGPELGGGARAGPDRLRRWGGAVGGGPALPERESSSWGPGAPVRGRTFPRSSPLPGVPGPGLLPPFSPPLPVNFLRSSSGAPGSLVPGSLKHFTNIN